VDCVDAVGHVPAAAQAAAADGAGHWELFQNWAEACWKGRVDQVIEELRTLHDVQAGLSGGDIEHLADDDPRVILARELGYLEHNRQRVDYPRDRREGLPWATRQVEATVKIGKRQGKGTGESWRGAGAGA